MKKLRRERLCPIGTPAPASEHPSVTAAVSTAPAARDRTPTRVLNSTFVRPAASFWRTSDSKGHGKPVISKWFWYTSDLEERGRSGRKLLHQRIGECRDT